MITCRALHVFPSHSGVVFSTQSGARFYVRAQSGMCDLLRMSHAPDILRWPPTVVAHDWSVLVDRVKPSDLLGRTHAALAPVECASSHQEARLQWPPSLFLTSWPLEWVCYKHIALTFNLSVLFLGVSHADMLPLRALIFLRCRGASWYRHRSLRRMVEIALYSAVGSEKKMRVVPAVPCKLDYSVLLSIARTRFLKYPV